MSPRTWRADLLRVVVNAAALLGTLVYAPSVWMAVGSGMRGLVVLDTVAILAALALAVLEPRLPVRVRAGIACGLFYAVGVGLLVSVGAVSQIYLLGFSVLATLLLGWRWGLGTVALDAVTVWGVGLAGLAAPDMVVAPWRMDAAGWTVVTVNFVFVNLCLVLAVGAVIEALDAALGEALARRDELAGANVALAAEIEERRRAEAKKAQLEAQLLQGKKLEALGSLAGGVAHDFNNLLAVVLSYADLVLEEPGLDPAVRADVGEIRKAGLRASDLTRQLLAFGRRQVLKPEILDAGEVVDAVVRMMGRLVGAAIELRWTRPERLGRCHVDRGQLEQVLVNLVVNARDAMPEGGRLTLEVSDAVVDAARPVEGCAPGAYVRLAVTDTGVGMDAATRERIFDPFFTTKDKAKGTGLGLSIAHGIVAQSGGRLVVESAPGRGTRFEIYFPRTDGPAVEAPAAPPRDAPLRGAETVLLVEDEPQVREVTRLVLERHGYRVIEAADGPEALARWSEAASAVDLLLTDVVMPRMSGRELADRLAAERPALRVLYVSGYTEDAIVHQGVLDPGIAFLGKPFRPEELLRKLRELLDRPATPGAPRPG